MYPACLLLVVTLLQSQREPFIKGSFSSRVSHKVSRPLSLVTVKIRKLLGGQGCMQSASEVPRPRPPVCIHMSFSPSSTR